MSAIFLWFYCLDIPQAWLVVLTATCIFLILRHCYGNKKFWKIGLIILLIGWAAIVVAQTVLSRTSDLQQQPILIPFQSYIEVFNGGNRELLRSNLMNVFLFYPAGLLTISLLPKDWKPIKKILTVLVFFLLLSIGIEYCQYRFALGLTQTDDVIHNSLGAILGAAIGTIHTNKLFRKKHNPN